MMWQPGGRHSTFAVKAAPGQKLDRAGEIFAFQHDPEALGGHVYTVFDDESDGQSTVPAGDLFVSWGGLSYFSEFSPSRKLLFNARLPFGVGTYRAYLLPWPPGR